MCVCDLVLKVLQSVILIIGSGTLLRGSVLGHGP